jgi:formylmethanofuran dehydrogenase subunit E
MYIPETIRSREDYQTCVSFHGHTCMGVTIGYLAAKLALNRLNSIRSVDEELVVIVETDACCCDAIQVLTGCTFGKGNFFYKDYGKMAFTFGSRTTGEGIRLLLKQEIFEVPEREGLLGELIRCGKGSTEDIREYEKLYESRGEELFKQGPEAFFVVRRVALELPPKAPMAPSEPCDVCGEMVMKTKLLELNDKMSCAACRP